MAFNIADRLLWQLAKLSRLRFWYLAAHGDTRLVSSLFVLLACAVSMVILGTAAYLTSWAMIFPSLGPTIFLMFYAPASPMAAPRNAVLGHLSAALIGVAAFWAYRWLVARGVVAGAVPGSVTPGSIGASALALGLTAMFMTWTGLLHPPAASTTMIASMGLMYSWSNISVLILSVALISLQAWAMHRLNGIKFPLWAPSRRESGPRIETKLGEISPSTCRCDEMEELAHRLITRRGPDYPGGSDE